MADIKFEIVESIATLSTSAKGWTRELNIISWNDGAPKYDIRDWAPDHDKMGKGVTLNEDEMTALLKAMSAKVRKAKAEAPAPAPQPAPKAEAKKQEPKPEAPKPEKVEVEVVEGIDAEIQKRLRALMGM